LSYNLTGSIILTSSCNSRRSCLINWHTYITISITLSPPSLALSLKILFISRSSIRGIVSSYLIYCYPSLIPPSIASIYYAALVSLILSISVVMPSCSCYIEKGLVCVVIAALSSHQPFSCAECIKANICSSYNIYSISAAKCIHLSTLLSYLVLYLSCYRVLNLIHY